MLLKLWNLLLLLLLLLLLPSLSYYHYHYYYYHHYYYCCCYSWWWWGHHHQRYFTTGSYTMEDSHPRTTDSVDRPSSATPSNPWWHSSGPWRPLTYRTVTPTSRWPAMVVVLMMVLSCSCLFQHLCHLKDSILWPSSLSSSLPSSASWSSSCTPWCDDDDYGDGDYASDIFGWDYSIVSL